MTDRLKVARLGMSGICLVPPDPYAISRVTFGHGIVTWKWTGRTREATYTYELVRGILEVTPPEETVDFSNYMVAVTEYEYERQAL